jgi:pimeloyl-ACP methyl ester carboxylesterase
MATLIALHGFTQNGTMLRSALTPLMARLPPELELRCPDGPVACSAPSVERMHAALGGVRMPAPYRSWWDATPDGRVYRDWELGRELILAELQRAPVAGVLGFSQGGNLAAIVAALSARGELPAVRCAIMIAGRAPRAELMQPWFAEPIAVPSLHIWGERDVQTAPGSRALVQRFEPSLARTVTWPGPHVIPTRGPAADAVVEFITAFLG